MTEGSPEGSLFQVKISVDLSGVTSVANLAVTFKNPCLDPDFLSVSGEAPDFTYQLGDSLYNQWNHDAFKIEASDKVKALCGNLHYQEDFGTL